MPKNGVRSRNLFDPASDKPYKLSRSKLEMFLKCPRCFYLDRRLGIGQPQGPAFTLNTAFTDLIVELQSELNDLQQAQLFGEQNTEERERLEKRIEELKLRKADRLRELEVMMKLAANLPDVLTQAIVLPAPAATLESEAETPAGGFPMQRDDEVEAIAMDVTMRYERSRGWTPYDVSRDGEHYDVRSESPDGDKRFIEVKGRSRTWACCDRAHPPAASDANVWFHVSVTCRRSPLKVA